MHLKNSYCQGPEYNNNKWNLTHDIEEHSRLNKTFDLVTHIKRYRNPNKWNLTHDIEEHNRLNKTFNLVTHIKRNRNPKILQ